MNVAVLTSSHGESKMTVNLPSGWLTYDGLKTALQEESGKRLRLTLLENGGAEFSKADRYEAIRVLRAVYPEVEVNTTAVANEAGTVRWCGAECQNAEGDLCVCACDGENHGGGYGGDAPIEITYNSEDEVSSSHTYRSEGLPKVGVDLYYLAVLFEDRFADEYLAWRSSEIRERVRHEVNSRLLHSAYEANVSFKLHRWRLAKIIADQGYGTLTNSQPGKPSNAEDIILDYVVEQHDGGIDSAIGSLL